MRNITKHSVRTATTRNKFQSWLDSKPPNDIAGTCCNTNLCVFSQYLSETVLKDIRNADVEVYEDYTIFHNPDESSFMNNNPQWLERFIYVYDDDTINKGPISYKTASNMLRNLKRLPS